MTRNEFLTQFANELNRRHVADAAEILEEYREHFAFKQADGYSEEEIAAKLGDPLLLAAQFEAAERPAEKHGKNPLAVVGLCFADLFAGMFFILLAAFGLLTGIVTLISAVLTVCLFGGLNICALIPPMPYWCGAVLGLAFAALTVLSAVCCIYYTAFLRQLCRAFARFHHNTLAAAAGGAMLPPLAIHPQFSAKANRGLRSAALISLALFAACFVLSYLVCSLSAGALEFWHAWGWFA